MKVRKISIVALIIVTAFFVLGKIYIAKAGDGTPTFDTPPTPENEAVLDYGENAEIQVSGNPIASGEHGVVLDWDESLVGWWRFNTNGDLDDYSTHGNDATNNGATWNSSGKYGGAYSFNGSTDYISVTSDSSLQVTDNLTVSAWIKASDDLEEGWKTIVTNQWNWPWSGFLVSMDGETGGVHVAVGNGESFDATDGETSVADGLWHLVTVSFSSGDVKIYVDANLDAEYSTSGINSIAYSVNNLEIGKNCDGDFEYWNGLIDDVQVYNRVLTPDEIGSLHNASDNPYNETFSDLSAGTYTYKAYTQTADGVIGTSEERSLTIENPFPNDGTEDDPYQISTCADLQNIDTDLDAYYILVGDVDCSDTSTWNDGEGFDPIGEMDAEENFDSFTGVLDGQDHKITDLYINRASGDRQTSYFIGLFSTIANGAEVKNLGLEDVDITGYSYVGALAGSLSGTATSVYSTGNVSGYSRVGGLVGNHVDENSFFNSSPLVYTWNGEKYTFVADVGNMLPKDTDGLDLAQIDSWNLVPKDDKYSMKISEEYNEIVYYDELKLMTFDHEPGYTVVAPLDRDTQVEDLRTVSDNPTNPLLACSDAFGNDCLEDLQAYDDKWSYKDESFVNTWVLDFGDLSNKDNIQLIMRGARDFAANANGESVRDVEVKDENGNWVKIYDKKTLGSDGTPRLRTIDLSNKFLSDDYHVRITFSTLNVNYFAIDTSDQVPVSMNTYVPTKADLSFRGFTSIDRTYFFDHNYDEVSPFPENIFANQFGNFTKYGDVAPLLESKDDQFVIMRYGDHMDIEFPYVAPEEGQERSFILYNQDLYKHATNDNIGDLGKTVEPLPYSGMTKYDDGYPMTDENIEYLNSWNTRTYAGTIRKDQEKGSTIINSYSSVNVSGEYTLGGLVGYNEKEIVRSYATGDVVCDEDYAGGLVGYNSQSEDSVGWIHDSYFTGAVSGNDYVGGLVGYNYAKIEKSYFAGQIESGSSAGGLVGYEDDCDECSVSDSFWDVEISQIENGEEGTGKTTVQMKDIETYTVVQELEAIDDDWQAVSSGGNHFSLAIKSDGTLWAWGDNYYGQLGLNDTTERNEPIQVGSDADWQSVTTGVLHSLAIKSDGTLWAWGYNEYGQLGLNDATQRSEPTQVGSDNDWQIVSAGSYSSFAIKNDGTLWAWGHNDLGKLGLNDTTNRDEPVQVGSETDWQDVTSGANHTLAIKTNGTLWAWGYNYYGQLGLNDAIDRNEPIQVGSDADWQNVSAGGYHTLAVKNTGTLWACGYNPYSQLGTNDTMDRDEFTQIGSATDWQTATAGEYYSTALKNTGTIWSWGNNGDGQLGLNDAINRDEPTQIGSGSDWQTISAGDYHTLAIKDSDTLWAWGNNYYGELGLNDNEDKDEPTQIFRYNVVSGSEGLDEAWDFEDVWGIDSEINDGYPYFLWRDEDEDDDVNDEDNEEDTPEEDEPERAKITSWSAFKYTDSSKSCTERLKLTIKGKHFDDDAKVFIGGKEASSVNVKNSKKLTAKFCLTKLLDDKTDHKRKITVQNPNTDEREAKKQIDLNNLSSENEQAANPTSTNADYFSMQTNAGVKNIQTILNKLGYLDQENITGTYGPITTEAVKKFQQDNGIEPTGFVGELTKAKLKEKM